MSLRVTVLGAGALGSWAGARLAVAGHEVTLVTRREDHVATINAMGLTVTGKTELLARPRAVLRARDVRDAPDLLVVSVKAYDTQRALDEARHLIGAGTRVLSLQNGLGNYERVLAAVPSADQAYAGVTTHGVTYMDAGHVRHAGVGYTYVGGGSAREEIARAFTGAGVETRATENVHGELWAKAIVNAGINPITAITGLRNGALVAKPELADLMARAVEEAVDVARAEGARLPDDDMLVRARRVAELTFENKSSMLQDVERGRRTEIDAITGEIVRRGRARGIDAPVSLALYALVRGIEATVTGL